MPNCTVCQDSSTVVCAKCRGLGRVGRSGDQICPECESSEVMNCPNCYSEPEPEVQATSVRGEGQVRPIFVSSTEEKANFLANVGLFKHLSAEVL